jgi:hypothetical protein
LESIGINGTKDAGIATTIAGNRDTQESWFVDASAKGERSRRVRRASSGDEAVRAATSSMR